MMPFSRFFSKELGERERIQIYNLMGLGDFSYLFVETAGDLIVSAREIQKGQSFCRLQPTRWSEIIPDRESPVLRRDSAPHHMASSSQLGTAQSLWEELFPFPFSLLGEKYRGQGEGLSIHPTEFFGKFAELWETLKALEEAFAKTEINCLMLKGTHGSVPLLFHYVRGKCLRVALCEELAGWAEAAETGQLDRRQLRSEFGTSATYVHLNVSDISGPQAWLRVASLLKQQLREGMITSGPAANLPDLTRPQSI